jgi:quercetin dioxygenase-like cupin family protein
MTYYAIQEIPPKKPADGIAMRVIHGERMTFAYFTFTPGTPLPEHRHPHEQIGTVVKGEMELTIGGETRAVSAGGAYHIPSDTVHSARCLKGPAEVIEVFSPVREDWLQR